MKRSNPVWLVFLPAVLLLLTALLPLFRGESMNVAFFALASFWLILGIVMASKARQSGEEKAEPDAEP